MTNVAKHSEARPSVPVAKPVNIKEYDFKSSKYETAPCLPFSQIIIGPSGSGKGILL